MEIACPFKGCLNTVDQDSYCYGCKCYVCEEHSENPSLVGSHEVEEHWTVCDVCGEGLDSCSCGG